MLDALDELCKVAGMCGFTPANMVIHSPEVFDRVDRELGYCTRVATFAEVADTHVVTLNDGPSGGLQIVGPKC